MRARTASDALRIVSADRATAADLDAVFGERGDPASCRCQWFKLGRAEWRETSPVDRAAALREQTRCGHPGAGATSGLVAYLDDEPVGWVAVEPRTAYPRLRGMRVPWQGRQEDADDDGVWLISCFVVVRGRRGSGIGAALARAAVEHARERGARAVEGYAREPGDGGAAELYVGTPSMFEGAGLVEVARPGARRVVMRLEL